MISRRDTLKLGLSLVGGSLASGCSSLHNSQTPELVGCSISGMDEYALTLASSNGAKIESFPLPDRGHGVAYSPVHQHLTVFARRPGRFMQVIDLKDRQLIKVNLADKNRHFYGHGCYSADGRFLYATEGDSATSEGIIGVYDVTKNYEKVKEFTGFGIGPHEVILLPNGNLAIGVGGVRTSGRLPTNLDSMPPALVQINQQGKLVSESKLPNHHLSIRHLSSDNDGLIYCGQQYRGDPDDYLPLVAVERGKGNLEHLGGEEEHWARFNHYIASIASNDEFIVATSPRGNCYGVWQKQTLEIVKIVSLPDASGVVVKDGRFVISSGIGKVMVETGVTQAKHYQHSVMWDNHWSRISS